MALVYTEEQKELIAMVKDMAEKEVKPHVAECDRTGVCPIELFTPALEMGLHLAEIPEEYGGMGLSFETTAMMYEELAREALTWPFTDSMKICAIGASQGAFSTAVAAMEHPDIFAAVILMYGAYVIMDDVREMFPERESVPDPFDYRGWSMMGSCYLTDLWDFDMNKLSRYKGPVLVLHGDDDPLVDPSYSRNVAQIYDDAQFYLIKGGRHGFKKGAFDEAAIKICDFLADKTNFVDGTL